MAEWVVELRKHGVFMVATWVLLALALGAHLLSDKSLVSLVWVVAVLLLSGAWAVYACGQVFSYVARGDDVLLHLSDQGNLKKLLLKTAPLVFGFTVLGIGTVSGYLRGAEQEVNVSVSSVLGVMGAKMLSVAAIVAWGWVLARCVGRVRAFGLQLALYGVGWVVTVSAALALLAAVVKNGMDNWFIGVTDVYNGLPLYVTAIPVVIDQAPAVATLVTVGVNSAAILAAIACEALRRRPGNFK